MRTLFSISQMGLVEKTRFATRFGDQAAIKIDYVNKFMFANTAIETISAREVSPFGIAPDIRLSDASRTA